MLAAFGRMSAARLSARTGLKVKCLFAIDAIAAVYRADSARFENGSARLSELGSATHRADQLAAMQRLGLNP
jgi:hypothetical protein